MFSSKTKHGSLIMSLLLTAALLLSAVVMGVGFSVTSAKAAEANIARTYYYEELKNSELAQKFYKVMQEMADKGQLDDGTTPYNLSKVVSQNEIAEYVSGNSPKIPVAFGAARDAFYLDHPDLFYVDVYKLYLTAGMQNNKYVAFIDPGNAKDYYIDGTVTSKAEVATAKTAYETAVSKAVAAAKDESSVIGKINAVNKYISDNTEYDYGALESEASGGGNGYVNTAYGALVLGKAICGGYSNAFKAVMDRLNIPCVLIQGSSRSARVSGDDPNAGYVAHMWNAVEVDGLWYAVDVTWNDTGKNLNKYTLVGEDFLSETHVTDNVISTSGFELKYPALRPLNYGISEDDSGFEFKDSGSIGDTTFGYSIDAYDENDPDSPPVYSLTLGVSFEGKNYLQLQQEGKYLAARYDYDQPWFCPDAMFKAMDVDLSSLVKDKYTVLFGYAYTKMFQFAIIDYAPNAAYGILENTAYDDSLTADHIIAISTPYLNNAYGNYTVPPSVVKRTPSDYGYLYSFEPTPVTLQYDEQLIYENPDDTTVDIMVTGQHSDIADYVTVTDVKWDAETNTVAFTFTPSKYLAHNCEHYNFVPTNLIGKDSRKTPNAGTLSFKQEQIICPKILPGGRLYMKVFGNPEFVSATDESLNDFKDESGKPVGGGTERAKLSQLMLVVNAPSKAEEQTMNDMLYAENSGTGLTGNDAVLASSTYQIDLYMCGMMRQVPSGAFMQVGFGFPEGYGPDDEGVTFTVYHYKRDSSGKITSVETVPCVITRYGIMATVESFSPFMICAVDSGKVAATSNKAVYITVNGEGGKVDNDAIQSVGSGSSASYTLTPDSGYKVDRVLLNGADITDRVSGNSLSLGYDALANNNSIDVTFISERAASYYSEKKITVIRPQLIVSDPDMIIASTPSPSPTKNYVGLIIGLVIAGIVVLAGVGVALYFFVFRKRKTAPATAGARGASPKKASPAKPAAKPTTTTTARPSSTTTARPSSTTTARPSSTSTARPGTTTARPSTTTTTRPSSSTTARPGTTTARPSSSTDKDKRK